jgi:hypothetical protein
MIDLYCASYHKGQLASDRTSCLDARMRLILHTAAGSCHEPDDLAQVRGVLPV